ESTGRRQRASTRTGVGAAGATGTAARRSSSGPAAATMRATAASQRTGSTAGCSASSRSLSISLIPPSERAQVAQLEAQLGTRRVQMHPRGPLAEPQRVRDLLVRPPLAVEAREHRALK